MSPEKTILIFTPKTVCCFYLRQNHLDLNIKKIVMSYSGPTGGSFLHLFMCFFFQIQHDNFFMTGPNFKYILQVKLQPQTICVIEYLKRAYQCSLVLTALATQHGGRKLKSIYCVARLFSSSNHCCIVKVKKM